MASKKSQAVAITAKPLSFEEIGSWGRANGTRIASITDKLTKTVRGADMDELGKLLGQLVVTAKDYDPKRLKKGGILRFIMRKGQELQNQFNSVDSQIHMLATEIEQRVKLFKDRVQDIEGLEQANQDEYYQLGEQIDAMAERIQWMKDNVPEAEGDDPMSIQQRVDWLQVIDLAEHRKQNLMLLRVSCEQMAPQFRLMKTNSVALSQKFDDIKEATLPAWKRTFSNYILLQEQQKGVQFAQLIDDSTNEAFRRSADLLETNTVEIHKSLGRQVIDISTLEYTQTKLVNSLVQVKKIAEETRIERQQALPKIEAMSRNLGQQLEAIGATTLNIEDHSSRTPKLIGTTRRKAATS